MNRVCLVGNLTKKPQVRAAGSYTVSEFTVAVTNGNKDYTDFVACESWGKVAEIVSTYGDKGKLISVEGTLKGGMQTRKNGDRFYKLIVVAQNIRFLGKKDDYEKKGSGKPVSYEEADREDSLLDEDIPF